MFMDDVYICLPWINIDHILTLQLWFTPAAGRSPSDAEVIKLSQQLEMAKFKSFWKESETAEAETARYGDGVADRTWRVFFHGKI